MELPFRKSKQLKSEKVAVLLFDPLEKRPPIGDLMRAYIDDLHTASNKTVSYELLPILITNVFPPLRGGQRYTREDYQAALLDKSRAYQIVPDNWLMADYEVILNDFGLIRKYFQWPKNGHIRCYLFDHIRYTMGYPTQGIIHGQTVHAGTSGSGLAQRTIDFAR